jgi:peroxin-1
MAPSKRQPASPAQIVLVPSLKSCLVNLPPSLNTTLTNSNILAQNVVVELTFRQNLPSLSEKDRSASIPRSVFVGWTGLQSQRKPAPVVGREGISGSRGSAVRDQDIAVVELDPVFARLLSLSEGQKVGVILHVDPPQVHTINIEPLTPADWEMIELSAQFLEMNFLSQVRALPNPAYSDPESSKLPPHPITLHLSPTSTVNVIVVSVAPPPPSNSPFVKISPDAEIIVAPKERPRERSGSNRENRSTTSKKSTGGRSGASTVRKKSSRDHSHKGAIDLRGIDRSLDCEWFNDEDKNMQDEGLKVWVDPKLLLARPLKGVHWASVSILKPHGAIEKGDPQKEMTETEKPSIKVVAKLSAWDDAPDSKHAALSSLLCRCLSAEGMVGGQVRIQGAPAPLDPSSIKSKDSAQKYGLKILPFIAPSSSSQSSGLKFGGESKQEREESAKMIRELFSNKFGGHGLLDGPLTDKMLLPVVENSSWHGGILKLDPSVPTSDGGDATVSWLLAPEKPLSIEFDPEVARPSNAMRPWNPGEPLPTQEPSLVGIDSIVDQLINSLTKSSTVLLTGGLGSGKTNVAQLLAHILRHEDFFYTVYFPCRAKMTGEYKVSNIRETFERVFAAAKWGAGEEGRALVILDDVDAVCFAETELGEGGDNVRSRGVSEDLYSIVQQYCSESSRVVLLSTAQSKEALNNIIIGSHVVEEIINLAAPNKEMRRRVLELVVQETHQGSDGTLNSDRGNHSQTEDSHDESPEKSITSRPTTSRGSAGFDISPNLDFLDIAGQIDGYMPGDLILLASRARSECLIRSVTDFFAPSSVDQRLILTPADFAAALKGFTPASLRNVTLQTSTVRWSSIGGLRETRQILLETLQYPTTYAPVFSKCPLRLRSGILLYGYPGCGKTLLASAIATECGLNFISVKGPEILNKYIGASEKSVRDLFERAQAARPCVLFFDEFDSIAPKRGHDSTGVTDRVVNQLLTQMDGAEGLEGVYVLGATSRPDLIDPALLRPGRLDKSIICDMPGFEDRVDILQAVALGLKIDREVDGRWGEVAKRTEGYSGADLQALVYNAQLEAVHEALGDIGEAMTKFGGSNSSTTSSATNGTSGTSKSGLKRTPDFDFFRLGDDDSRNDPVPQSAKWLSERAGIAARLREMQVARRKAIVARKAAMIEASQSQSSQQGHQSADSADDPFDEEAGDGKGEDDRSSEPTVFWRHFVKSMRTTRSSISPEERRRLQRIYGEFLTGRSGDLPTGEGGTEIGGRTSLM